MFEALPLTPQLTFADLTLEVDRHAKALAFAAWDATAKLAPFGTEEDVVDTGAVTFALQAVISRAREEIGVSDRALAAALVKTQEFLAKLQAEVGS